MEPFVWNLISFIVALGILIFVHEYGHFWVARRNGIKVLRFAIGFGKPIFSWRDKQDTEYTIGLIPLGGYVRMLDERVDDVSENEKSVSFNNKSVGQRIAVVAAGPMANFIFAIIALFITFLLGVPTVKPVVGDVTSESAAEQAGLMNRDEIIMVNDVSVSDWEQTQHQLVQAIGDDNLTIGIERDGAKIVYTLDTRNWQPEHGELLSGLGITPYRPQPKLTIHTVVEGSAAERAGIQRGDTITKVNGEDVDSWSLFVNQIANNPESTLTVEIQRNQSLIELNVTPDSRQDENGFTQGYLGVAPEMNTWPKGYVFDIQYAIFPALIKAVEKTWSLIKLIFSTVAKLIVGDISINNLSGPISIAQGAGVSAQGGLIYFLGFLALISVNLGVVNLLPLPVLDGGHLMYFFIELIRGKPVSERVQEIGFRFGALILMMIMGIAIINDFGRL